MFWKRLLTLKGVIQFGADYNAEQLMMANTTEATVNGNLMQMMVEYVDSIRSLLDETGRYVILNIGKTA